MFETKYHLVPLILRKLARSDKYYRSRDETANIKGLTGRSLQAAICRNNTRLVSPTTRLPSHQHLAPLSGVLLDLYKGFLRRGHGKFAPIRGRLLRTRGTV